MTLRVERNVLIVAMQVSRSSECCYGASSGTARTAAEELAEF
jgi:hypothetical protein